MAGRQQRQLDVNLAVQVLCEAREGRQSLNSEHFTAGHVAAGHANIAGNASTLLGMPLACGAATSGQSMPEHAPGLMYCEQTTTAMHALLVTCYLCVRTAAQSS
jgi:hypothetical protein